MSNFTVHKALAFLEEACKGDMIQSANIFFKPPNNIQEEDSGDEEAACSNNVSRQQLLAPTILELQKVNNDCLLIRGNDAVAKASQCVQP